MKSSEKNNYALATFICSLFFWVPLFNIITNILTIIFAVLSYREIIKEKKEGMILTTIGIVIAAVWIGLTVWAIFVIGPEQIFSR